MFVGAATLCCTLIARFMPVFEPLMSLSETMDCLAILIAVNVVVMPMQMGVILCLFVIGLFCEGSLTFRSVMLINRHCSNLR